MLPLYKSYLVSLVVVLLKLALSSAADAGLIRERGLSFFSETDLHYYNNEL